MDDLDVLQRLDARVQDLEQRISALEHATQLATSLPARAVTPVEPAPAKQELALPEARGLFSVMGKAMLGIAGAYVLRAVAESGSFPKLAVVVLALAYAGAWLVSAAWVPSSARITSTAYAATAALILAAMLGELTLHFHFLPALATAGLLSVFVAAAFGIGWKRNLVPVVWVIGVTGVLTALALLIASHDLVPYTAALLFVALVSEGAAARNRWLAFRLFAAPAVDIAVWILVYIYSLPQSSRSEYISINTSALLAIPTVLFLIYGTGMARRTVFLRQRITVFEIAQAVLTFVLAALTWLWFLPGVGRAGLGIFCWVLAGACYTVAFLCVNRSAEQHNYHVYATWAVVLLLVGAVLMLPPLPRILFLSVASIVAILVGSRVARLTLGFHGLACLAVAALASGLPEYTERTLAGSFPGAPDWTVSIVAVSTLLCYAIGGRFEGKRGSQRLFQVLAALLAVSAVATFLVLGLFRLASVGMALGPSHVAVIRTLATCALSVALAFGGARWERIELVWTAYGALAFVTVKLLFEDVVHGHSGSIAVSIFLYAAALIIVPRVARPGRKQT
jgi:hypothetical protein